MAIEKEHKKFYAMALSGDWKTLPGYPSGIMQSM
jgi:hypothetical protein